MKKVVVLGANSFSGQDFVDLMLDQTDTEVIGVSRSPERSDLFLSYRLREDLSKYQYFQCDMNQEMERLLDLLDEVQPEWVVNFAAQSEVAPSWVHPEHWFQTNTVALARLVNHLRTRSYLKRYLHISSPEVYGNCRGTVTESARMNPSTPYAASKASADFLLNTYHRQYDFPLLTVRATNVYGARQQLFKIIPRAVIYIHKQRTIELHGGGSAIKSYIHIRDVSRGELAILNHGKIGELYHLAPDRGIAIRDVVSTIATKLGTDLVQVSKSVGERPGQDAAYIISSQKARQSLGWRPEINFSNGIDEVIQYVDSYWTQIQKQALRYRHQP